MAIEVQWFLSTSVKMWSGREMCVIQFHLVARSQGANNERNIDCAFADTKSKQTIPNQCLTCGYQTAKSHDAASSRANSSRADWSSLSKPFFTAQSISMIATTCHVWVNNAQDGQDNMVPCRSALSVQQSRFDCRHHRRYVLEIGLHHEPAVL